MSKPNFPVFMPMLLLMARTAMAALDPIGAKPTDGNSISPSTVTVSNLQSGSVVFSTTSGTLSQDNANFFYDRANTRLGLGTSSPQQIFHALGTPTGRAILVNSPDPVFAASANTTGEIALFGTAYSASNASMLDLLSYSTSSANPLYRISNHWEGSSSSGTIAIGYYQGSTFNDVLAVTSMTRVGIGTINPLSTFDVKGSAAFGTYGGANAAPSNGLVVSGSVGVGTANPSSKLHMSSGTLTIDGNTNNMLDLSGSSALMGIRTINPAQAFHLSSGTILVDGNANALKINSGVGQTSTLVLVSSQDASGIFTILGGGQVGIGITNPVSTRNMQLNANQAAISLRSTASGEEMSLVKLSGAGGGIRFEDNGGNNVDFQFYDNGNMFVRKSLGMGTSNANATVHVSSAATGNTSLLVDGNATNGVAVAGSLLNGFGTLNPITKLHMSSGTLTIDGNTALSLRAIGHSEWNGTAPSIASCGTGASIVGSDSAGHVVIGTGGSTVCALTFANAFTNRPHCVAQDETTATLIKPVNATTSLTLTATLTAGDTVQYWCPGN